MLYDIATWGLRKLARAWQVYVEGLPSMAVNLGWLLLLAGSALLIEYVAVGWQQSSLRKIRQFSGSVRNDLFAIFLNYSSLGNYIAITMTFSLIYFAVKHLRHWLAAEPLLDIASPLVAGLVYILIADFVMYWFHRCAHRWQAFWEVHAYHHSACEMTILSGAREHPLFFSLTSVWLIVPALLVQRQAETGWLLAILVATRLHGLLIHSNITAHWGWVGRWLLVSPAMHRIHHGRALAFHDKNFGSLLTLWDHLFGTFKDPRGIDVAAIEVGLDDLSGAKPPLSYLLKTYRRFALSVLWHARRGVGRLVPALAKRTLHTSTNSP